MKWCEVMLEFSNASFGHRALLSVRITIRYEFQGTTSSGLGTEQPKVQASVTISTDCELHLEWVVSGASIKTPRFHARSHSSLNSSHP